MGTDGSGSNPARDLGGVALIAGGLGLGAGLFGYGAEMLVGFGVAAISAVAALIARLTR